MIACICIAIALIGGLAYLAKKRDMRLVNLMRVGLGRVFPDPGAPRARRRYASPPRKPPPMYRPIAKSLAVDGAGVDAPEPPRRQSASPWRAISAFLFPQDAPPADVEVPAGRLSIRQPSRVGPDTEDWDSDTDPAAAELRDDAMRREMLRAFESSM